MKAAVLTGSGVEVRDVPKPKPGAAQVLVRVRAAGLNRADLIMASGHMHGSAGGPGAVLGLEFAGEVEAVGSEVQGVKAGDRVMCSGNGGYAEYAVTDWGRVARIPANNMSWEQAATLPVALQTMHDAVVTNGRLKAGERLCRRSFYVDCNTRAIAAETWFHCSFSSCSCLRPAFASVYTFALRLFSEVPQLAEIQRLCCRRSRDA
jgi:D-arabinose 1-dehydrogenase-like Zn-dependent alcohol dehydrogenase